MMQLLVTLGGVVTMAMEIVTIVTKVLATRTGVVCRNENDS